MAVCCNLLQFSMPDKLPNYRFSREKDREVSSTEARVGNLLRHFSLNRKPRRSRPEPLTNMSSTRPAREAIENKHVVKNPSEPISNTPTAGSLSAADFGALHDRVQEEVARLDEGTKASNNAIVNLSKVFHEHAHIIRTVGERWGRDQNLEEEIRNLTVANKEMWKHRNVEDEEQKTRMAELEDDAKAGKEEKQKYEWIATKLKDDYRQKQQMIKREHEEAREQDRREVEQKKQWLENNMADTIAALQKQKADLTVTTAGLQHELGEKQKELERERENNKRIQESLSRDINVWKSKYDEVVAKYAAEERPTHYYAEKYEQIQGTVEKISASYFTYLPENAIENPTVTSDKLVKKTKCFVQIPILETLCSQVLRVACVKHIIFNAICDWLWQPFLSEYLLDKPKAIARTVMTEIYTGLKVEGGQVQRNWKVSTLKMLDRLDDSSDLPSSLNLVIGEVIETLRPLLDDRQIAQCQEELRQLFIKAVEFGKTAERDRTPVQISRNPSLGDSIGWIECFESKTEDSGDVVSPMTPVELPSALYVTPKIYRPKTADQEEQVLCAGSALFPNTGIIQQGWAEWESFKKASRELAYKYGRERKTSMDSTVMVSPIWGLNSGSMNGSMMKA